MPLRSTGLIKAYVTPGTKTFRTHFALAASALEKKNYTNI